MADKPAAPAPAAPAAGTSPDPAVAAVETPAPAPAPAPAELKSVLVTVTGKYPLHHGGQNIRITQSPTRVLLDSWIQCNIEQGTMKLFDG